LTCSTSSSGHRLHDELPGRDGVAQRVLGADGGELHDRRLHRGDGEERVRREVVHPVALRVVTQAIGRGTTTLFSSG
jgi:hypothetical protein